MDGHLNDFMRGNHKVTIIKELCQILSVPAIRSHIENNSTLRLLDVCNYDEAAFRTPSKVAEMELQMLGSKRRNSNTIEAKSVTTDQQSALKVAGNSIFAKSQGSHRHRDSTNLSLQEIKQVNDYLSIAI